VSQTGYIYITNWDDFQHYKDRRPVWIKNYVDLLENDAYLDLSARDRALLEGVWKLTGVCGNGRVSAVPRSLKARLRLRYVNLDPLSQAGFLAVRASKALAIRYQVASTEVLLRRTKSGGARRKGSAPAPKKEIHSQAIAYAPAEIDLPENPLPGPEIAARVAALTGKIGHPIP
jgi:hypothetical protein